MNFLKDVFYYYIMFSANPFLRLRETYVHSYECFEHLMTAFQLSGDIIVSLKTMELSLEIAFRNFKKSNKVKNKSKK